MTKGTYYDWKNGVINNLPVGMTYDTDTFRFVVNEKGFFSYQRAKWYLDYIRRQGAIPEMVTDGLLSEWRFSEGTGSTVADSAGSNDIDLTTPTSPNVSWTAKGVSLASGLVQTPSITGARTVAMLYRVGRNEEAGFILSGGLVSGSGVLGSQIVTTITPHIGVGQGVTPVIRRTSDGRVALRVNRGGWVLLFCEFDTAYNTVLGLGGRHSTTTSRCADFELAWVAVWDDQLSDAERAQVYDHVRGNYAKPRSIYIDWRDAPTYADTALLWGQSNADGRAKIADLSADDQSKSVSKTFMFSSNIGTVIYPPAAFDLGTNQQATAPSTDFGPEMQMAYDREDAATARQLWLGKTALGSTYLASPSVGSPVTNTNSWNADIALDLAPSSLLAQALRDWFDLEQYMLSQGVGPRLRGLCWMQGEQDATGTTFSADYQANLQALYDTAKTYTGYSNLPVAVGRIRDQDPTFDATAVSQVRAAQAAFVTANSSVATLIDTDAMSLATDDVHYDAAGQKALGSAFYDALFN